MNDFLIGLLWFAALLAVFITLAYRRIDLGTSTIISGFALLVYTLAAETHLLICLPLWIGFAGVVALNFDDFRRRQITEPLLSIYRTMVPSISDTEREALEAGTVWWDGELFTGMPDWSKLLSMPAPAMTDEEQAFLDGPTEELCRMLDDWEVSHVRGDLSEEAWKFIREEGFFSMIIPKEYGGLEFSPIAVSAVLTKLSAHNLVAAVTVGVPNSLGPGELLLHYGTDEQKQHYLPKLASGEEIPCFALTSPRVGSDAAAITDNGVVCKGTWQGEEIVGIRLNWDKRYITLAPVATVLGLAFKLYDPDHLIGEEDEYGITAALIPVSTPGVVSGRRHLPLDVPFMNGPTQGKDVFVPLDFIIGGVERAGQGWRMLMEQLSAGRGVTLPSNSLGGAKAAVYAAGAYTRIRKQFNLPVGKFEGVSEALARMAGNTHIIDAALSVTMGALARGEKPPVPSAILKYHCTELGRVVANDAMDVHGGKAIMMGPRNYLGRHYMATPIGITVEGANILTRSLIIYGQGAIRCHPFVLAEMEAASNPDTEQALFDFDRLLFGHIGYAFSNAARSFVMALTHARFTSTPVEGPTRRYFQHINRYSAAFALASDVAMLVLGGDLKRRETLSARLGDVLSDIYLASMVLKHYEDEGRPADALPLVEWSCRALMYHAQEQLHGFLRNFPNRPMAAVLRMLIFPRGRTYSSPSDRLGRELTDLITRPTDIRERLCRGVHNEVRPGNPLGLLQKALQTTEELAPLERKIRDAVKAELIEPGSPLQEIDAAEAAGVVDAAEASQLRDLDALIMDLIAVDDFDSREIGTAAAS